jgi:hypothetical protein
MLISRSVWYAGVLGRGNLLAGEGYGFRVRREYPLRKRECRNLRITVVGRLLDLEGKSRGLWCGSRCAD